MKRTIASTALALTALALTACGAEPDDHLNVEEVPFADASVEEKPEDRVEPGASGLLDRIPAAHRDQMLAQIPLKAAASRIRWAVEDGDDAGFAGIVLEEDFVVLWWKGPLSESMRAVVDQARADAPVEVRPARHSLAELKAEAAPLRKLMRENPSAPLHTITLRADGSGIGIRSDFEPAVTRARLPALRIPFTIAQERRVEFQSRLADTAPYYGGNRIVNTEVNRGCSSAFGVKSGSTEYLLTAGHCGRVGARFNNGDGSRTIGTGSREHVAHDLLLIGTDAGSAIFDGGVGSGEFTKGVAGWDWVHSGEGLCMSPSVSGVICGIRVSNELADSYCGIDIYGRRECYNDLILASRGDRVSQGGDSGGPYFSLASNNRVTAKGVHSGMYDNGQKLFQDFGTARRDFGIEPLTR